MAEDLMAEVERIARQRISENQKEINYTLDNVAEGNPLASEQDPARLVARLMTKNLMNRDEAEATAAGVQLMAQMTPEKRARFFEQTSRSGGAEAVWGQTIDFVSVAFLNRGRRAANAVARVAFQGGRAWGSGFMVSDRIFLTNHHVIPSVEAARDLVAEFDYELDDSDNPISKTVFSFDPGVFFITDGIEGLDFTLIAIGKRAAGAGELNRYGYCTLSDAANRHAIGEVVNIVQHPKGRYKEVVLRENRLVARGLEALHYVADTEPGSSGSPVFNNEWQPIALHHWGGPYRGTKDEKGVRVPREVNEGIRISSIVRAVRGRRRELPEKQRALLEETLRLWEATSETFKVAEPPPDRTFPAGPRINSDGSIAWTFPIEISVRAPLTTAAPSDGAGQTAAPAQPAAPADAERAMAPSEDYSDRNGYEPGFIPGHVVPLLGLSAAQERIAARNNQAPRGDNPFELKYHHFSVVINAERKMAFYAACNIDGRTSKYINRKSGAVEPLDPSNTDHGLMEALLAEGAEATEEWYDDNRVPGDVAGQDVYKEQNIPGFPTSTKMARTLRIFQRGHLVRRLDPAWGSKTEALLGEADTFHFTNCAPQVGFFNMGKAPTKTPRSGGGKLWRAVENIVLRNARTMRTRVTSFTGPIFSKKDRAYRTIKIPQRFFKVAVWADEGGLRSLAMIADQSKVIDVWPEALFAEGAEAQSLGGEAFQEPDELDRVDDFLTTIEELEAVTDLDFGDAVREADVRRGEGNARPANISEVPLEPGRRGTRRGSNARKKKTGPAKRKSAAKKKKTRR